MMKALLVIWIGLAQSQTLSITVFDTVAECEAALTALGGYSGHLGADRSNKCVPYKEPTP